MKKGDLKQFAKGSPQILKKGGKAVIYNRVSSVEQLEGQSLEVQEEKCRCWAHQNGYEVIGFFGGSYESAKSDLERTDFQKMLSFVRKNRTETNAIVVYNTSRFSRTGSTTVIEELEKMGVPVFSAVSSYDPRTPEGKLVQGVELSFARYDNATKARMVRDNGKKALYSGRWINNVPRGYDIKTSKAKQEITITPEGNLIRTAFLMKANEGLTNEEVRQRMAVMGLPLPKQRWTAIFNNVFYCGYFSHPFLEGDIIKGTQEPIVSEEMFLQIQKQQAKFHSGYEVKTEKEYAPLLGSLKCPVCGRNLTAALSTKLRNCLKTDGIKY